MIFKLYLQKLSSVSLTVMFVMASAATTAQVYNDSGTIRVMNGSSLVSLGNFTNEFGTVTNDGKIEVQGNFTNKRIYNSVNNQDSLLLSGQRTVTLLTGAVPINNLAVNKTDGGGVTLIATTTINSSLSLLKGSFSTNPEKAYELIAPASAAFTFGPGTEIAGKVRRTNLLNGIPVIFNQANMSVTIKGGVPPATLLVNMVPGANPTLSGREVKRYFRFSPTGGTNYTADITFPYNIAELNSNSEANLVGWYNDGTGNWKQKLTGNDWPGILGAGTGIP